MIGKITYKRLDWTSSIQGVCGYRDIGLGPIFLSVKGECYAEYWGRTSSGCVAVTSIPSISLNKSSWLKAVEDPSCWMVCSERRNGALRMASWVYHDDLLRGWFHRVINVALKTREAGVVYYELVQTSCNHACGYGRYRWTHIGDGNW